MDDGQSIDAAEGQDLATDNEGSLALDAKGRELFKGGQVYAKKLARMQFKKLPSNMEFDDLHQAALIGLAQASARYDSASLSASFETFAGSRINGAMLDFIRKEAPLTRGNAAFQTLVNRAKHQLLTDKLDRASDAQIAEKIGMEPQEFIRRRASVERNYASSQFDTLSTQTADGDEIQVDAVDEGSDTFDIVSQRQRASLFLDFKAKKLNEREQLLVDMVYDGMPLKAIGEAFGFSESRACQIMGSIQERLEGFIALKFGEHPARPSRHFDAASFEYKAPVAAPTPVPILSAPSMIEDFASKLSAGRQARGAAIFTSSPETDEDGKLIIKSDTRWG